MSLIFTNTPAQFQPVLSDGIYFTLSADTSNKFKFRYVYDLYVEDQFVFRGKATPNPYSLGIVDLQQVLETYTNSLPLSNWDITTIYTHTTFPFSRPYNTEVINYYIKTGYEYADSPISSITGFTGINDEVGDPEYTSDVYKVFRSTMGVNGNANEQNFNYEQFVLSGTPTTINPTTSGLFLTNSPRIRNIAPTEYYTLAFTNYYLTQSTGNTLSEPYYAEINYYDAQGNLVGGTQWDNLISNGGGPRTQCSDVYPALYLIDPASGTTDYNTLYIGAGPMNIPDLPADCVRYTIQLFGKFTGTTSPIVPSPTPTPYFTPSPTPTITSTPSATPICAGCTSYDIQYTGDSESLATITIVNCLNGQTQNFFASYGVIYSICSCQYPLDTGDVSITNNGACNPNPTQTPTPSITATPTKTPSPTPTKTPTNTPSVSVFSYLGRTAPVSSDGPAACAAYVTTRSYQSTKALSSLGIGDYLYDSYPSTPTNGGGLWVALKVGGVGQAYSFQVQSDGEITDTYLC